MPAPIYVRVRPASQGGPVVVRHPETQEMMTPNPALPYRIDDPLVREYPWLFVNDERLDDPSPMVESVRIETAARRPGRSARR